MSTRENIRLIARAPLSVQVNNTHKGDSDSEVKVYFDTNFKLSVNLTQ